MIHNENCNCLKLVETVIYNCANAMSWYTVCKIGFSFTFLFLNFIFFVVSIKPHLSTVLSVNLQQPGCNFCCESLLTKSCTKTKNKRPRQNSAHLFFIKSFLNSCSLKPARNLQESLTLQKKIFPILATIASLKPARKPYPAKENFPFFLS